MKKLITLTVVLATFLALGIAVYLGWSVKSVGAQGAVTEVPFLEEWEGSGHNDAEAEAFVHWNEDDPADQVDPTPGGNIELEDPALGDNVELIIDNSNEPYNGPKYAHDDHRNRGEGRPDDRPSTWLFI